MKNPKIKIGDRFGYFVVVGYIGKSEGVKAALHVLRCDCGTEVRRRAYQLHDRRLPANCGCKRNRVAPKPLGGDRAAYLFSRRLDSTLSEFIKRAA